MNFGKVDTRSATPTDAAAQLLVTCTNGTAWKASASAGIGPGATLSRRRMSGPGGALLDYSLYTDPARVTLWGDGNSNALVSSRGTGVQQSVPIYGRVFGQQNAAPAGSYADRVTIRVSY